MATLMLDRQHTALLIADFYAAFMSTLPHAVDRQVVEHTQRLQHVAREADLFLCYCATVFRPGYVEISERNKTFSARKHSGQPPISDPVLYHLLASHSVVHGWKGSGHNPTSGRRGGDSGQRSNSACRRRICAGPPLVILQRL